MAFHDSVPGHKSPASLRTILRIFRIKRRVARILTDVAGIEILDSQRDVQRVCRLFYFGRVPSAQSHCCSAACRCKPCADRWAEPEHRLRVPNVDGVFNQKQENVLCKLSCFEQARCDGATSLATLNPADTRSYEARYQSCRESTVA